jgi:DNA-binding XRE family transcriptional regulator
MKQIDTFSPVSFNPQAYAQTRSKKDAAFAKAYEELSPEFAVLDVLLRARREAGLSQAQVAQRMGIAPASLARIEASVVSHKHSPSLTTLRKYAKACGRELSISLR